MHEPPPGFEPLPASAPDDARRAHYDDVLLRITALIDGEDDWIAALATVVCELHHAFAWFHWTGFYRRRGDDLLIVGPYQGGHGCLRITFDRGVCGAAARMRQTQRVDDVEAFPGHIACSSTTRSEIVVPVFAGGVLDGPVVAGAAGIAFFAWLRPQILAKAPRLAVPVLGYVAVITVMVAMATGALAYGGGSAVSGLGFAAAIVFWASDITVAMVRFAEGRRMWRLIGLPLYYGAQFLFVATLPGT